MKIPKKRIFLPQLPFRYDALEPVIHKETIKVHYNGHHASYVKNFNSLISRSKSNKSALQFNYYGHILHSLYWNNLAPIKTTEPYGALLAQILEQWGALQSFIGDLISNALQIRGSGWTLVLKSKLDGSLKIKNISNHDLSDISKYSLILIVDAWEHAYYLDYRDDKKSFFENLSFIIDWETAEKRFVS